MTKKTYRNYVFDLYGTLADIQTDEHDPALWRAFSACAEKLGIREAPEALRDMCFSACRVLEAEKEKELAARGVPGPGEIDFLAVWEIVGRRHGVALTADEKIELSHLFRSLSTRRLRLFPQAKEILDALRRQGKKTCLLTNAQATFTLPELKQLGIDTAFDRIFISSEAGVKKPSPAFFGLLLRAGFDPRETLMIGNDDECDCRGAAAAGMDSMYIRTWQSPPPRAPLPDRCREIHALPEILDCAE